MTPELEHKIVEYLFLTTLLLSEVIEDNDREPAIVGREMAAIRKGNFLLEQLNKPVETTHETRTVQQPCSKTPAGGDGK